MATVRFEPVKTFVHGEVEARLVFVDDKLAAVVVQLGSGYGDLATQWSVEACFNGFERLADNPHPDLNAIESMIATLAPY